MKEEVPHYGLIFITHQLEAMRAEMRALASFQADVQRDIETLKYTAFRIERAAMECARAQVAQHADTPEYG